MRCNYIFIYQFILVKRQRRDLNCGHQSAYYRHMFTVDDGESSFNAERHKNPNAGGMFACIPT